MQEKVAKKKAALNKILGFGNFLGSSNVVYS